MTTSLQSEPRSEKLRSAGRQLVSLWSCFVLMGLCGFSSPGYHTFLVVILGFCLYRFLGYEFITTVDRETVHSIQRHRHRTPKEEVPFRSGDRTVSASEVTPSERYAIWYFRIVSTTGIGYFFLSPYIWSPPSMRWWGVSTALTTTLVATLTIGVRLRNVDRASAHNHDCVIGDVDPQGT